VLPTTLSSIASNERGRNASAGETTAESVQAAFARSRWSGSFSTAAHETLTNPAAKRSRLAIAAVGETEAAAATASRFVLVSTAPTTEHAAFTSTGTSRDRQGAAQLHTAVTYGVAANRLRATISVFAEQAGGTLSANRLRTLAASISESELHSFRSLARVRAVVEVLNTLTESFGAVAARDRNLVVSLHTVETVDAVAARARELMAALKELEQTTSSAARRRDIQHTLTQVEAVAVQLHRYRALVAVEQAAEHVATTVAVRERNVVGNDTTVGHATSASTRLRAMGFALDEIEQKTVNLSRFRHLVATTIQTEGVEAATARIRGVAALLNEAAGLSVTCIVHQPPVIPMYYMVEMQYEHGGAQIVENWTVSRFANSALDLTSSPTVVLNLQSTQTIHVDLPAAPAVLIDLPAIPAVVIDL
jgi:hypothetical protein